MGLYSSRDAIIDNWSNTLAVLGALGGFIGGGGASAVASGGVLAPAGAVAGAGLGAVGGYAAGRYLGTKMADLVTHKEGSNNSYAPKGTSSQQAATNVAANTVRHWNPLNGHGPLGKKVAATFRSATYTELVTSEATTLYRAYGGKAGELGAYWTRTPPTGALQSQIDSALLRQWGITAQSVTRIQVPPGTKIFEGIAASKGGFVGGGNQVFIPRVDPSWIIK
jgi:hypothetical protein